MYKDIIARHIPLNILVPYQFYSLHRIVATEQVQILQSLEVFSRECNPIGLLVFRLLGQPAVSVGWSMDLLEQLVWLVRWSVCNSVIWLVGPLRFLLGNRERSLPFDGVACTALSYSTSLTPNIKRHSVTT